MSEFWVGPDTAPETYQLISLLGGGGEGEVWRAHLQLSDAGKSEVAVKLQPATGESGEGENWQQVAHLLRSLSHPGLVRVTDAFIGQGTHRQGEAETAARTKVLVMDYVEGPTVREWVDENPDAPASSRIALLRTVASALDEMHSGRRTEVPVAHGDVKPANIIVSNAGSAVLVDLGLARLADARGVVGRSNPYAAPELRGADTQATPAGDAFAFAVTLAQVLLGAPPPVDGEGFLDVAALQAELAAAPATRNRPRLVEQIVAVVTAAPTQRPTSLRSWLDATLDSLSHVTEVSTAGGEGFAAVLPASSAPPGAATGAAAPAGGTAPPPQRPRRRAGLMVAAVAAVILAVVGGGYALASGGKSNNDKAPVAAPVTPKPTESPTPTPTESPTPTPTESPTETPTEIPTATDTPTATDSPSDLPTDTTLTTTQWVNELDMVDTNDAGETNSDGYSTNGRLYPHSLEMVASCYAGRGGSYYVEYDLARSWSTLTGTIGLDDTSPASGHISWKVLGDGKVLKRGANNLGTSTRLSVPVTGVLRLRILIQDNSVVGDNCPDPQSGLVLGDLELIA